jgi:hypothetical protein
MSVNKNNKFNNYLNGAVSGFLSVFFTQPFQVIRTSMTVTYHNHEPPKITHIINRLFKEEGIRGFYRGFKPTVIGAPFAAGFYFLSLETNKRFLQNFKNINKNSHNFISAALARVVQCLLTNPVLLVITRFEVIGNTYKSFLNSFLSIYKEEGFKGYFQGLRPYLLKEVPTGALFYTFYEIFKTCFNGLGILNIQLKALMSAVLANTILTVFNNPLEVLRTRIQYFHISRIGHHNYQGLVRGIVYIAKVEGLSGLLVGVIPRLMKRTLGSTVVWTTYETLKALNL